MGQLVPPKHTSGGLDGTPPCPACVIMQQVVLEASKPLEQALLQLHTEDVGSICALLFTTLLETLPTQEARNTFLESFAEQVTAMTMGGVAMLSVEMPAETPTKGEVN